MRFSVSRSFGNWRFLVPSLLMSRYGLSKVSYSSSRWIRPEALIVWETLPVKIRPLACP